MFGEVHVKWFVSASVIAIAVASVAASIVLFWHAEYWASVTSCCGALLALLLLPVVMRRRYDGWMQYYDGLTTMPIVEFTGNGHIVRGNVVFKELVRDEDNLFKVVVPTKCSEVQSMEKTLEHIASMRGATAIEVSLVGRPEYTGILNITCNLCDRRHFLGFLIDITEFKNLEVQFYHSQKMQAIGQLAGGIAHDFNNIMTTVLGVCDLLLMQHSPSDQSFVCIKQIQQNAIRAINLVKQLLAFSRKQILTPSLINISETLDELSNNLLCRLLGENIKLELQLDRNQWMIRVDESQFEQVIINLAVNARDAMHSGGTLTVRTSHVVIPESLQLPTCMKNAHAADSEPIKSGEYVVIEIRDEGVGIPDASMQKIFDPFYSTKPLSVGSGLGLSTVYGIVKQTSGYIYVVSEVGVGTTFYVLFRSAGPMSDKPVASADKAIDQVDIMDLTGTETIMVVEDEMHVRALCASALKNKGYTILEAESCEIALQIFQERSQEISLIVTDIVMSGMRGSDFAVVAAQIKPSIKIILISGYIENTVSGLLRDDCVVLPKPFTLKQLASTVRQLLDRK